MAISGRIYWNTVLRWRLARMFISIVPAYQRPVLLRQHQLHQKKRRKNRSSVQKNCIRLECHGTGDCGKHCSTNTKIFDFEMTKKFSKIQYGKLPWKESRHSLNWALCVPSSCHPTDVENSVKQTLNPIFRKQNLDVSVKVQGHYCTTRKKHHYTLGFYITRYYRFLHQCILINNFFRFLKNFEICPTVLFWA